MTWLLVALAYGLLCAAYLLGHELGYMKGRREAWGPADHFNAGDLARLQRRIAERKERTDVRAHPDPV